jgi:aspartyl-tRNA(Asn)/glutamyl-tRNA(Gln) amidotransferase subunit A
MRDLDAVVTLSSLLLPCRIDDPAAIARTYDQQAGWCSTSPARRPSRCRPDSPSGVPLAMQIAGRAFDEPMVYRIAQAYCEAAGTCIGADVKTQPRLVATTRTAAE